MRHLDRALLACSAAPARRGPAGLQACSASCGGGRHSRSRLPPRLPCLKSPGRGTPAQQASQHGFAVAIAQSGMVPCRHTAAAATVRHQAAWQLPTAAHGCAVPPAGGRTSIMMFFSSSGSLGSSRNLSRSPCSSICCCSISTSSRASSAISGSPAGGASDAPGRYQCFHTTKQKACFAAARPPRRCQQRRLGCCTQGDATPSLPALPETPWRALQASWWVDRP